MSIQRVTRRQFVENSAFLALGLPVVLGRGYPALAAGQPAAAPYAAPKSPRATLNFNYDWKFVREDVAGAEAPAFDDSQWTTVATPHSFNDVDSFRKLISHSGGDTGHLQRPRVVFASTSAARGPLRQQGLPRVRGQRRRHILNGSRLPVREWRDRVGIDITRCIAV